MPKKTTIRRKILYAILSVSFVTIAMFCAAVLFGFLSIRDRVQESSRQLSEFARDNSSTYLVRQAADKLLTKAQDRAVLVSERLLAVQKDAVYFADYASEVYRNAHRMTPVHIPFSSSENFGQFVMQLRSANGVDDYPRIRAEVGVLGNIASAYLSNVSDMFTLTSALYIGTESGFVIGIDAFSSDESRVFDPRARPWYIGARENLRTYWTAPYIDFYSGRRIITCAHPVFGPNNIFKGVTGIDVMIDDLDREVVSVGVGEYGYAFIVDNRGYLISSVRRIGPADTLNVLTSAFKEPEYDDYNNVIRNMIRGGTGFERVMMTRGEKFIAWAPINITGWSLAIVQPVAEVMELVAENNAAIEKMAYRTRGFVNALIMISLGISFFAFVAAALVIIYLSRRLSDKITRPIVKLEKYLKRIAAGDLDMRIDLATGDEIERLGMNVNTMAQELKEYVNNLQEITAEKERIGAELNVARTIQASMLPRAFPPFPGKTEFHIHASMQPAREVGGDFFDFFFIDQHTLAILIADVSGKGIPAALFMAIAKVYLKTNAQTGKTPAEVFETVNNLLCESNDTGMFVTVFMGYLNTRTGKFSYVNAGHTKPLLHREGGLNFLNVKPGFILGGIEDMKYEQSEMILQSGDELFLYTDGVTESVDKEGNMFGNARLADAVCRARGHAVSEIVAFVKSRIGEFAQDSEPADDITMLMLRYNGEDDDDERLTVAARSENLYNVQKYVLRKTERASANVTLLNHLSIVVEEIFVNICSYAYDDDNNTNPVTIRAKASDDKIVIEFEDYGKAYDPILCAAPDVRADIDHREVGGLGIFMAKRMTDGMDYRREDDKNILTVWWDFL